MTKGFMSGRLRFTAGLAIGLALVGSTAYSLSVNNTPEGGYLLCANKKTKVLTYSGKLSCPSGTTPLEMGAAGMDGVNGEDGQDGEDGNSTFWFGAVQKRDIVGPNTEATKFEDLKKVIVASISKSNLTNEGNYLLEASLTGLWGSGSKANSYVTCYFQSKKEFPNGTSNYGRDSAEYGTWTSIDLRITAYTNDSELSKNDLYLVCASNGNITDLSGMIRATSHSQIKAMNLGAVPNV